MSASTLSVPRSSMTRQVMEAVARGWSVIPVVLHGTDKKPAVKWSRYMTKQASASDVQQWQEDKCPQMWGLVAGAVSGLVILDFDGEEGRALMAAWGLNPHIRTGSGGYHVYVQHPGWPVKTFNSKSPRPWNVIYPGLDIRADGGYAVFAGRNANGPYEALRELAPDPLTVLPNEARAALGLLTAPEERPQAATPVVIDLAYRYPSERLLTTALEMVERGDGRDNAAFWLVKQLQDNQYTEDEAAAVGLQYVEAVPQTDTKGNIAPFTAATMQDKVSDVYAKYTRREPITTLEDVEGLFDQLVAALPYKRLRLVEAPATPAVATPTEAAQPQVDSSVRRITYTPLTFAQVLNRPRQEPLLTDILMMNSVAILSAAPGAGKSFFAYDLALSVATDTAFLGREVKPGTAVVIAAEGISGAPVRLRAFMQEHELEEHPDNFYVFPHSIPLSEPTALAAVLAALDTLPKPINLVVVDTLARCYVGNENLQEDANKFISALDRIKVATGGCVLALHHTNKGGTGSRGSTVFPGGSDTMLALTKDMQAPEFFKLTCEKQKDGAGFEPIALHGKSINLGDGENSLVMELMPEELNVRLKTGTQAPARTDQILSVLEDLGDAGATHSAWESACTNRLSDLSGSAFARALRDLKKTGRVTKGPGKFDPYTVVSKGGVTDMS